MKFVRPVLAAMAAVLLLAGYFLTVRVPSDGAAVLESGPPGEALLGLKPGFHVRRPGSRVILYADLSAETSGEVLVTPSTGGEVPIRFKVSGRADAGRIAEIHRAAAGRTLPEFLASQAGAILSGIASQAEAVELLTPAFRDRAAAELAAALERSGLAQAQVDLPPADPDTLMAATHYLASRGEAFKVRLTLAEALRDAEGARSWKLLTAMGYVNESEKLFLDAEKNYLDALALDPAALPPMAQLVTLYSAVGEWAKLRRVLDAARAARPDSLQHINWLAMVMTRLDDPAGAERMLRQGLEQEPDNAALLANLGALYVKQGRVEEARAAFQKAVDSAPSSQQALFNMGSALAAEGRHAEALPYLERAAEAGPMSHPLASTLAAVHAQAGDAARAALYRKQAEQLRPPQGTGGAQAALESRGRKP
ncbi:MAG TPA: tetratricopeptide repeat protein [Candidatus Polarisedimenticolia bacterium]|nr:tetratricopeptide repeat protein [Candidatus Polarisedimenticolia bacterium]